MKLVTKTARNGLRFTVQQPENEQEYDALAKRAGAMCDDACDNIWYRGVFPDFWEALAHILSQKYDVARKTKDHPEGKKDANGRVIQVSAESDPQYVDRVAALHAPNGDPKAFQPLVDDIAANGWDYTDAQGATEHVTITFDPSVRERKERVPKPGKGDLELAVDFLTKANTGEVDLAKVLSNATSATGKSYSLEGLTGDALTNYVALVIRDYRLAIAKQAAVGLAK